MINRRVLHKSIPVSKLRFCRLASRFEHWTSGARYSLEPRLHPRISLASDLEKLINPILGRADTRLLSKTLYVGRNSYMAVR